MHSILRYILLTALRDLLFAGLLVLLLLTIGVAFFLGGSAMLEQQQMVIAYVAGATRVVLITGLLVFICFHVKRAFDTKEIEVMLSRPISRTHFVLAYWAGFSVLGLLSVLVLLIVMYTLLPVSLMPLLYWGGSLALEVLLIMAFAVLAALVLQSAVASVLACFCFYVVARMMGFFIATIHNVPHAPGGSKMDMVSWCMEWVLRGISMLLPRLDMYGKTAWLLYGIPLEKQWLFIGQSLVYIPFLLAIAVFDFRRKQF